MGRKKELATYNERDTRERNKTAERGPGPHSKKQEHRVLVKTFEIREVCSI